MADVLDRAARETVMRGDLVWGYGFFALAGALLSCFYFTGQTEEDLHQMLYEIVRQAPQPRLAGIGVRHVLAELATFDLDALEQEAARAQRPLARRPRKRRPR